MVIKGNNLDDVLLLHIAGGTAVTSKNKKPTEVLYWTGW